MLKSNGFTAIEAVLVIIVVAALGFAGWTWWNVQQTQDEATNTSDSAQQEEEQEEDTEIPEDWHQYQNSELGYTFWYPANWSVDDNLNENKSGNEARYIGVVLRSGEYTEENQGMGGPDVVKGAQVRLSESSKFSGNDLTETFEGLQAHLLKEGAIQPDHIKVNENPGIEYVFAYEGPKMLVTKHFINDDQYVTTRFMAEGEEKEHPRYETYKTILETIEAG